MPTVTDRICGCSDSYHHMVVDLHHSVQISSLGFQYNPENIYLCMN